MTDRSDTCGVHRAGPKTTWDMLELSIQGGLNGEKHRRRPMNKKPLKLPSEKLGDQNHLTKLNSECY